MNYSKQSLQFQIGQIGDSEENSEVWQTAHFL